MIVYQTCMVKPLDFKKSQSRMFLKKGEEKFNALRPYKNWC